MRGLVSPTGYAALRQGAALSVTARALSRRSGMLGWRVRASRPAPDWCLASLALGISFRSGGEGAVSGQALARATGRRLRLPCTRAPAPQVRCSGSASSAAPALPCVPACRPSRADGGDSGFEGRNRWYLLIYSLETVFIDLGRTRRAHGRAWATFPTRQAAMWANEATGRPGALSAALPVSALRVTARPMGIGECGWLGMMIFYMCVRSASPFRLKRGEKDFGAINIRGAWDDRVRICSPYARRLHNKLTA